MDGTNIPPSRERVARNESETCGVKGCFKRRYFTHQYCDRHRRNVRKYGHPKITNIVLKQDIKPYRLAVRAVMKANEPHPGQRAALDQMTNILNPGPEPWSKNRVGPQGDRRHLWEELTHLKRNSITAAEALEAAVATWYLAMEQSARFPDQKSIAFAIGRSVITLTERPICRSYYSPTLRMPVQSRKHITGGAMNLLGTAIMENLVSFATQVRLACEATRAAERMALTDMKQPLVPGKPRKYTKRKITPTSPSTPVREQYVPRRAAINEAIPEVPTNFFD